MGQGGGRGGQPSENPPAVVPRSAAKPAKDVHATWVECSPKTSSRTAAAECAGFSAAIYYFGLRLHKELGVPIGLIESAWGGSHIEPWMIAGDKGGQRCTTA